MAKKKVKKRKYKKRTSGGDRTQPVRAGKRTVRMPPKKTKNTTGYEVKSGVSLPWGRVRRNELEYPFEFMAVGDSFQFQKDGPGASKVYSGTVSYCRMEENFHKKFVCRKIKEETFGKKVMFTFGCWRMSDLSKEEIKEKKEKLGIQFG